MEHDARDFVNELCRQAGKLDFLIAALLKASRLETGMLVLKPQRRRVYPMLLEARKQAERRAMEKRLAIEIKPDDSYAYFDPKWTAEAVYNVIDNAVKYTKEGGKITVEAGGCIASISGQAMAAAAAWDGKIEVAEYVPRFTISGGLQARGFAGEIRTETMELVIREYADHMAGRTALGGFCRPVEIG